MNQFAKISSCIILVGLAGSLKLGSMNMRKQINSPGDDPKGFAVIELFTSEGCSSCPPADEAVVDIANEYKKNVFVIGLHVDYWNSLGWKDVFSNASNTTRQKQYAGAFRLNSIYTPQIVVNGKTEFVGSDKKRLHDAVSKALDKPAAREIKITAKANNENKINVSYSRKASRSETLNIILVQLHAQSDVKRGENGGKKLQHINVARDVKSINNDNDHGDVLLTLPEGLTPKDCHVIAYLQNKESLEIYGATEAEIN